MKKSQQLYLLFLCFLGMVMFAIVTNYRGFLVPTYKQDFHIDNTQMGIVISVGQLISAVFTYYGGLYCLRWGQNKIVATGCFIVAVAMVLFANAHIYWTMMGSFCLMSCGAALIVVGLNALLPMVTLGSQAIIMNVAHGTFGLGSTFTQKFLAWYFTAGLNWRVLFLGSAALFVMNGLLMIFAPIEKKVFQKRDKIQLPYPRFARFMMFGLSFYVLAEFLISSWVVNYFQEGFGYTAAQAAFYSTLFYATFTVGRLGGGFLIHRIKRFKGLITCVVLAACTVVVGQTFKGPYFILIGCSGLFLSIVYPTGITLTNEVFGKIGAYFIGLTSTTTAVLIFVFNFLFGYGNDHLGVSKTFYGIPAALIISMVLLLIAYRERKKILAEPEPDFVEEPSFLQEYE